MDATEASGKAQRLTDEALTEAGLEDPRPMYRRLLIHLKGLDAQAFEEATRQFNETLVPEVADGSVPPLEAWLAYGRWLCDRIRPGKVVAIDGSGRAVSDVETLAADEVVLHLPDEKGAAFVLATPVRPTPSQQATVELLAR